MNTTVWCDLTEHVVDRFGVGALDAFQRREYLLHAPSCIRCRSLLGDRASSLAQFEPAEDAAVWPHLADATIRDLASLDEGQTQGLLGDIPDVAMHLEHCASCADRLANAMEDFAEGLALHDDEATVVGRSVPATIEWLSERVGEIGWVIENGAVPLSTWTFRLTWEDGIAVAEIAVESKGDDIEWQTFGVTLSTSHGLVEALTFTPDQRRRQLLLDEEQRNGWIVSATLMLTFSEWMSRVETTQSVAALRVMHSPDTQAPLLLHVPVHRHLHDVKAGAVALAGQLLQDRSGRPLHCLGDGSIVRGDDEIGQWEAVVEDQEVEVRIDSHEPYAIWLADDAVDYGVSAQPLTGSRERIFIVEPLAASATLKPHEAGRRFLERGRYELELGPKPTATFRDATVELLEHDRKLKVRWLRGRRLRFRGEGDLIDGKFVSLPDLKGNLESVLNAALEWLD